MCGLAGALGGNIDDRRLALQRLTDHLVHRGPDGRGLHLDDDVDLAHTRLAVLDPTSRASQPMLDESSGCVLVFNGEIYNFKELRTELEGRGHPFRSTGDTEVLLHAYLEWGDRFLERLNGMFAFALWDPRERTLLLARDRYGEKPLHLHRSSGTLWFSSEAGALVLAGIAKPAVDRRSVWRYLAFGDLGHPVATCFEGIEQLPAGNAARVAPDGSIVRQWEWAPPLPAAEPSARWTGEDDDRLRELFLDAVRIRMRSDVPIGTSLSGGLDSSAVVAAMRELEPSAQLHAFTASFPGTDADELPLARAVAERLGATVHPVPLGPEDLLADLDAMARANDQPVEAASQYAQFAVMRQAWRDGVTVLLDGQGADETWGGYEKYVSMDIADSVLTGRFGAAVEKSRARRDVTGIRAGLDARRVLPLVLPERARSVALGLRSTFGTSWLAPAFRREFRSVGPLEGVVTHTSYGHLVEEAEVLDVKRVTLPRLLRYGDRNSMIWSREVRLPYLDHRLVDDAFRHPTGTKLVDGWTKMPIRRLLDGFGLPDTAFRRDKKAYMPPQARWLDSAGVNQRVADSWKSLHGAGLVSRSDPGAGVLQRWRVLSLVAWADAFGLPLG